MKLQEIQEDALRIARQTGELLLEGFGQAKQIETKSTAIDLVTQYDTKAESFITAELQRLFPDHHLVAEEGDYGAQDDAEYLWFIDPLDGTINFAHGFPMFAVSLALYRQQQPLLGVVYDPTRDECFHAIRGEGAFLTSNGSRQQLQISETRKLLSSLLTTGFPYDRHDSELNNLAQFSAFIKRAQGVRRPGVAALDMAYVAAGRLDGYWEYKLSNWDIAAGVLLVQEAGGTVTGMDSGPVALQPGHKLALIASNGHIQQEMLDVLQSFP
jgi:myo-inositol-1(or 4)-monophosphatase